MEVNISYMDPTCNGRLVVLVVGLDSWDPLMNGIVTARVPKNPRPLFTIS